MCLWFNGCLVLAFLEMFLFYFLLPLYVTENTIALQYCPETHHSFLCILPHHAAPTSTLGWGECSEGTQLLSISRKRSLLASTVRTLSNTHKQSKSSSLVLTPDPPTKWTSYCSEVMSWTCRLHCCCCSSLWTPSASAQLLF